MSCTPLTISASVARKFATDMARIRQVCEYDPNHHRAPPVELSWLTRNKRTATRWVFLRCCGRLGNEKSIDGATLITRSTVYNRRSVTGAIARNGCHNDQAHVTQRHHPGRLQLLTIRMSPSQLHKHGAVGGLARWSCCNAEVPAWLDHWSTLSGEVPFEVVDSGCVEGPWHEDLDVGTGDDDVARLAGLNVARVARAYRRPNNHGGANKKPEYVVLNESITISVEGIQSCQKSVKTAFTDGKKLLQTMFELWTEQISISDLPRIRVAQRDEQWFAIDSRRLFLLKVLGVQSAEFTEISWMEEFDSKLRQMALGPGQVDAKSGIEPFRERFIRYLRAKSDYDLFDVDHEHQALENEDQARLKRVLCIPNRLHPKKNCKINIRYHPLFHNLTRSFRKANTAWFDIPKNCERKYPALSVYPLTIRVTEKGLNGKGYDAVMNAAAGRVKRVINRMWRRKNQDNYFVDESEGNESDEGDF